MILWIIATWLSDLWLPSYCFPNNTWSWPFIWLPGYCFWLSSDNMWLSGISVASFVWHNYIMIIIVFTLTLKFAFTLSYSTSYIGTYKGAMPGITILAFNTLNAEKSQPSSARGDLNPNNIIKQSSSYIEKQFILKKLANKLYGHAPVR